MSSRLLSRLSKRLLNWLISLDQFVFSTITLGGSSPDETMSAAAYRAEQAGKLFAKKLARPVIDFLFSPLESEHCYKAYLSEKTGKHLPTEYQND